MEDLQTAGPDQWRALRKSTTLEASAVPAQPHDATWPVNCAVGSMPNLVRVLGTLLSLYQCGLQLCADLGLLLKASGVIVWLLCRWTPATCLSRAA